MDADTLNLELTNLSYCCKAIRQMCGHDAVRLVQYREVLQAEVLDVCAALADLRKSRLSAAIKYDCNQEG